LAVFGVEDDQWGEKMACVVVPAGTAPDITELASWVKERMRSTKTPEVWHSEGRNFDTVEFP
jgi:fatty-acyl-CoA synthase